MIRSLRSKSLASMALVAGLMGTLGDLPKAVEAPRMGAFFNGRKTRRRDTVVKVTTANKKAKRKMATAARKRNR